MHAALFTVTTMALSVLTFTAVTRASDLSARQTENSAPSLQATLDALIVKAQNPAGGDQTGAG